MKKNQSLIVSALLSIKDPGKLYRPMYCDSCGNIRYHTIGFIGGERNEKGIFVWFTRRCSGLDPLDEARKRKVLRKQAKCFRTFATSLPFTQWEHFAKGQYW